MSTQSVSLPVVKSTSATDAASHDRGRIARELSELVEGEVRFGEHDRMLYATDASLYQVEPIGVVCPRSLADVEAVVRYCAENHLPLLPRGGGTSLAGQTVNKAVVIDFSVYLRALLEVDVHRRTARVQPGIVLEHLNLALAPHGLMFGPDVATSSHANLGGMIGNNSAGAYSILYGRTVEHLIALNVMLADGVSMKLQEGEADRNDRVRQITSRIADVVLPIADEIDRRFPKTVRRVDGYNLDLLLQQFRASSPGTYDRVNLAHLVCGSEGTLAVTTEATLNLVPRPALRGLAIVGFADVDAALHALTTILQTKPAAVELIDDVVIGLARKNVECCRYVDLLPEPPSGTAGAVLYVEYFADEPDALRCRLDQLQALFPQQTVNRYTSAAEMMHAWKLRKSGEPLLHGLPGARKPVTFIEDTAVDPTRLAAFVADFRRMVARHGTTAAYYAHASVGCLHIRPMICLRDDRDVKAMRAIAEEATDLVVKYGGALSGEHGDGRVRTHLLQRFYGPAICQAFQELKAIFDPDNRLNPGNLVDYSPQIMTDHLRAKPDGEYIRVPPVKTYFRYEREHGFGEAVEMCNGAGVCRRMKGGTMCPSYRATLDERHATRGRGNALRLAITGQFSADGRTPLWNDPETGKTLDLCLSCKACKSECPSNVDIAKLKAEYTAQAVDHGGKVPLATRIFGHVRFFNQLGSAARPIANALSRFAPTASLIKRLLRIHPDRELPRFERSLYRWSEQRNRASSTRRSAAPSVILFPDCFTVYNEPHIGQAAIRTLEKLGYRAVVPRLGCCGRSLISTGLLKEAVRTCRATALALIDCMDREQAVAVVGCEPSCISAIKDEWLELEMDVDVNSLHELAQRTFLIEQFIEARWDQHPIQPERFAAMEAQNGSKKVMLHGHCHQKALWGIESSSAILKRLVGDRLHIVDSGCCGMAGSFGYRRDHHDVSMKIGELSLFGPIRENPDAIIVAPGTSCRQQIHDGVNRNSLHPIELIEQLLSQNA